jgi:hypothetical protein
MWVDRSKYNIFKRDLLPSKEKTQIQTSITRQHPAPPASVFQLVTDSALSRTAEQSGPDIIIFLEKKAVHVVQQRCTRGFDVETCGKETT